MKKSIFIVFMLLFYGCSFDFLSEPKKQNTAINYTKPLQKQAIKGFIKELTYQNNKYCYEIASTDTKNYKLAKASFCSSKFYHNKGDLVYAVFIGQNLQEMILIRAKSESQKIKFGKKPSKTNISVPKEEKISFD